MIQARRTHSWVYLILTASLAAVGLSSLSCSKENEDDASQVLTDLGATGNQKVATTFANYKAKGYGCRASGFGKRAIVTGFGLFEGAPFNISGTVVGALGNKTFTPWSINLDEAAATPSMSPLSYWGTLTSSDYGGRVVNRTMRIDGEYISVCFITLDVIWDLAASIIVHEMGRFEPDMVLMSGRGTSSPQIEYGAINHAIPYSGYLPSGAVASDNTPVDDEILVGGPASLDMTWNGAGLASAMRDEIIGLPTASVAVESRARPENDYICNNVSYVALAAAKGLPIALAGGRIPTITLHLSNEPVVGFFHYPSSATRTAADLQKWSRGIAAMVKAGVD